MKPEFTSTGLDIQTFDEIFTEITDGYKTIYGSDINVDSDSPDGQRVGIEANHVLDAQAFAASIYAGLDPDLSNSAMLDIIIKICGLYRRPATRSQWDLSVTVVNDGNILAGYTVKDELDQEWECSSDTVVTAGVNTVTFLSVTYGAVEGVAFSTIEQVDYDTNVTLIEAPLDATIGIEEETDEELRRRRNLSLENPSQSTYGGLYAKIANLPGVTDLEIYENKENTYDATNDLDGNSIWVVVEGGDTTEIAEQIVKNSIGVGLKGTVEAYYTEEITRPDGTTFDKQHLTRFDRPDEVDIYVTLTATRKVATVAIDTAAIKTALSETVFTIGGDCIASALYASGYSADSNCILSSLEISDDDITYVDDIIDGEPGRKYTIDTANIDITEVI